MQVYIEYVIINNLLINALVLTLSLKFLRHKISRASVFISSAIGTVYAIFLPLYDLLGFFVFKIILALIMVAICTGRCTLKRYIAATVVFFALTFAMGGITLGLASMLSLDLENTNSSLIPFFVGLSGLIVICAQKLIYKHIILAKRKSRYEELVIISANGKEVACKAYYDSGNKLYYKNSPTIIIDRSVALQLYPIEELNKIDKNAQVDTVSGKKNLKVISLDYLRTQDKKEKIYGVVAAISDYMRGEYKVVLHCDV
ncbi:MAG: sigma-E processing peptidase SpoIIGA [Clostridia bacterium]|nr:sigma-E processing peptidase SpoIIGA [Clostridia bacterium]MDE7328339.1 sigma-E processing peptidase SpoIIGA [Clostridia bacterium]